MRFVYSDQYDLAIGEHVFPARKYRLVRERLIEESVCGPCDFESPEPASEDDLRLAHTGEWVRKLTTGTLSYLEILKLEIPYSAPTIRAFRYAAGGTILASRMALASGVGYNIGGGFHHGFADHGEGFCAINDIAIAIRRLQHDGAIRRAMVVDCDVHHGNGTAAIFAGDPDVFTLSVHQFDNYPTEKPPSTMDVHLSDGVGDADYLDKLGEALEPALDEHKPELVIYVAGADPYERDTLGGLALTIGGLERRDRLVIEAARRHGASVAVTLAGGYAENTADTVTIHVATARVAAQAAREFPARPTFPR